MEVEGVLAWANSVHFALSPPPGNTTNSIARWKLYAASRCNAYLHCGIIPQLFYITLPTKGSMYCSRVECIQYNDNRWERSIVRTPIEL